VSTAKTLGQAPDDADPGPPARADAPLPPLELPAEAAPGAAKGIPESTVARLPVYLRALHQLSAGGLDTVSSGTLAESAGVSPAQLRKDLSYLGSYGTRGVGYDVASLRSEIARVVGSSHEWPVVLVGIGNLGTALANYSGFHSRGFRVVGLVDPSPALVGKQIHGLAITDLTDLEDVVTRTGAVIGVIATPAEAAQSVADRLVRLGVTSILNFAATVLAVPDGVTVRKVDLGQELQILAYHEHRKAEELSQMGRHRPDGRGMIDVAGRDQARVPPLLAEIVHSGEKDV
jgi:redox-sensing transcriptional repressor